MSRISASLLLSCLRRRRRMVTALFLTLLVVAGLGALLSWSPSRTTAQGIRYTKLWPAFTMTYSVTEIDYRTGAAVVDQTRRLVVTNEYAWREDVTHDRVDPKEVGSYRQLKDGVISEYSAERNYLHTTPLSSPDAVTSMTSELAPTLFVGIRDGVAKGWKDASSIAPGRVTKVQADTYPCGQRQTCQEETTVAFDASSINSAPTACQQAPVGGIAVSGERRVNGRIVHTFNAESLQISR